MRYWRTSLLPDYGHLLPDLPLFRGHARKKLSDNFFLLLRHSLDVFLTLSFCYQRSSSPESLLFHTRESSLTSHSPQIASSSSPTLSSSLPLSKSLQFLSFSDHDSKLLSTNCHFLPGSIGSISVALLLDHTSALHQLSRQLRLFHLITVVKCFVRTSPTIMHRKLVSRIS